MDDDYPIPGIHTEHQNLHWASCFAKLDLSDTYFQKELVEDAKKYVQSTHRKDYSRFAGFLRT